MNQKITKNDIAKIQKKIFIFDGHNLIYKSYFALPKFYDSKGRPTGAIQGTCNILMKFLTKYQNSMFCIASDSGGKNFRHELFKDYKANRAEIEDDLRAQIIAMQEIYANFGISKIGNHGHEADDYIASFVKKFKDEYVVFIVSSDKDLMSLIERNVFMIDPVKEDFFDEEAVEAKFGIPPSFIKDYLSLIGDSSDNIPGVSGIGPKTALKILSYGHLDDLLKRDFEMIKDQKLVQKLKLNLDDLLLSMKLVEMNENLEINLTKEDLEFSLAKNAKRIYEIFMDYNLNALASRIEKFLSFDDLVSQKEERILKHAGSVKFLSSFTKEFQNQLSLSGICYINFFQKSEKDEEGFRLQILCGNFLLNLEDSSENIGFLEDIMLDSSIKKITYRIHHGFQDFLRKNGITRQNSIFDLSWVYFGLIGVRANENFQYLVQFAKNFAQDGFFDQQNFSGNQEEYIFLFEKLFEIGFQALLQTKQIKHFEIDREIYEILVEMENNGILLDVNKLAEFQEELEEHLLSLKEKIIDETGYDFNVISPKQTSEVLFEKLGITPIGKKSSKTGLYSTETKVLEELSINGIIAADYILEYRSLNKLKTSYCQSLPEKIDENTGRIHTKFWLNGATTGRILSSDPNLQNIPTRSDLGKKIRACFRAEEGKVLFSIDYSQIELRILSKLAGVQNLIQAFEKGLDVHRITASEVFGIAVEKVSDFERESAKAVNFGIIYGISPYGLSWRLKIPVSEASMIIKRYFAKYPEIQDYLDRTKRFFHENGYVLTAFGRRCYAPHFGSNDEEGIGFSSSKISFAQNQFLERTAINAPIQGTAADILKKAIILSKNLIDQKFQDDAKILLQIHDEIIFEVSESAAYDFSSKIKEAIETTGFEIGLKLKTESNFGKYWE